MELETRLREMPEILEIAAFLQNFPFKRRLFGCDKADALDCFEQVTLKYEAIIAALLFQGGQALPAGQDRLRWYEENYPALQAEYQRLLQENMWLWAERTQSGWEHPYGT